ncbi:hypothetical protein HG531_001738 [Fusarium graminearum]|nr:hypothetical protein HG531_001738 [Fusarium graminearum]
MWILPATLLMREAASLPPATRRARREGMTAADPLLLASLAGSVDSHTNLLVTLVKVLDNLLTLLLNLGDGSLLLNNESVHVLEELCQLDHLLLNLLKGLVTVLNGAQGSTGATLAVTLHHGLAENLATSCVLNSSLDLLLRGVGANDTVLPGHLVLGSLSELRLDLLVLGNGSLEAAINTGDMRVVLGRVGLGTGLDGADSFGKLTVKRHGLSRKSVELTVGGTGTRAVGIIKGSLLDHTKLLEVLLNGVDSTVDITALVENSVGVTLSKGATVVSKGLHFDATYPSNHVSKWHKTMGEQSWEVSPP